MKYLTLLEKYGLHKTLMRRCKLTKKKWADPIDRLLEADQKAAATVKSYLSKSKESIGINEASITTLDTTKIIRWEHKDRPENELGNINELAQTFKKIGQQQPCIVRPSPEKEGIYELIVGERRWRAAKEAGLDLKVIIKKLDNKTASLIQAVENEKRTNLSDYAKGMSYADKIEKGLIKQKDLTDILGISKQQVSRLLSYKRIPNKLMDTIGDFRKVSARTAYEIARLANKSEANLQALIEMSDKIADGKYGQKRIEKELERKLSANKMILKSNQKITTKDGRHLFTWRLDNNATPSIHFPKDIIELLNSNSINFDKLTEDIKSCVINKLSTLLDESPRGD